jgi:hypothetical protein
MGYGAASAVIPKFRERVRKGMCSLGIPSELAAIALANQQIAVG